MAESSDSDNIHEGQGDLDSNNRNGDVNEERVNVGFTPKPVFSDNSDSEVSIRVERVIRSPRLSRRNRRHAVKPDIYDGTEDWNVYLRHFTATAKLGQWSEEEKVLFLTTHIKGAARVFFGSLSPYQANSFSTLCQAFERRFGSTKQQTRWRAQLESRHRKTEETIASFGDDIRLITQRAYPTRK
jgi:hypothetical protein